MSMHSMNQLKQTPLPLRIAFILACFAVLPGAQALLPPPPPDGGYPHFNTAEGFVALYSLTSGNDNTAVGHSALYSITSGNDNTAVGSSALSSNTTGGFNTAIGAFALSSSTGDRNTALGALALSEHNTGFYNTATGVEALRGDGIHPNTGSYNTATGYQALFSITSGGYNTATGFASLPANTAGYFDTADGVFALFTNSTGYQNFGGGVSALYNNTIGHDNTACGFQALGNNQSGNNNIGIGSNGGINVTGSNNIDIGAFGLAGESNTIRIGRQGIHTKTYIRGIFGAGASGGSAVYVTSTGKLGTVASSARFKEQIKPMDKASEAILALKPVTFRYKRQLDPEYIPQFGLIAEDVEKVNPDLVVRDESGEIYTVRYDAVNAMLLNEFLKEHRKVEEQEATITQLKKDLRATVVELTARLKEQDSKIEKVSAQLQLRKPSPQMVVTGNGRGD
jgi:Chaperone of endosialidase